MKNVILWVLSVIILNTSPKNIVEIVKLLVDYCIQTIAQIRKRCKVSVFVEILYII